MDMSRYVKKFIRLADVAEGPIQQRIARVEEGKFGKPDLVFDSGESVGLNLTSNLALQRAYGQDSDDWIGKLVELYAGEVTFEGKTQTAVLIKPITPGLTAAEKLVPVAAAAAAKPVGRDKADNADMAGDDIPF